MNRSPEGFVRVDTRPLTGDVALLLGVAAVGAASAFLGWRSAQHPVELVVLRAAQGVGAACAEVAAMVVAAEAFPRDRRSTAEGLLETATGLGYVIGLPLAGLLGKSGGQSLTARHSQGHKGFLGGGGPPPRAHGGTQGCIASRFGQIGWRTSCVYALL